MPWNGQSLARPDGELLERRLPHELAGRLAERHQHAAIAGLLRIAHRLVVRADEHDAAGDHRIAVGLRSERGDPLHVLAGLDVPRRRQAGHRDTMLRFGVPPHIGQSVADTAADGRKHDQHCSESNRSHHLVPVDLQVVEIDVGNAVGVDAGAALAVRDLVDLLDRPRRRLRRRRRARPCRAPARCRPAGDRRAASCGTTCRRPTRTARARSFRRPPARDAARASARCRTARARSAR